VHRHGHSLGAWALAFALASQLPSQVRAQAEPRAQTVLRDPVVGAPPETEHLVTLALRGGALATDDQRQVLQLDREGASAELTGALRPLPWLAGEVGLAGYFVGGRGGTGALLDATLGVRVMPHFDRVTLHAHVAVGVGVTGDLVVPVLAGSLGVWVDITSEWSIGPEASVRHVVWEDGPTRTSDALFVGGGLSVAFRPRPSPPTPADTRTRVRVVTRDRVEHRDRIEEHVITTPPTDPEVLMRLVDRAVPATVTRSVASMIPPLLFEHDRTELSSCGEASLYDLLRTIDEAPSDVRVIVEGHADGTGDDAYNRALSARRAEAVRDFLVAHGVSLERIELRARGEGAPLVDEIDDRALSMNRRVVVHLERTMSPPPASAASSAVVSAEPSVGIAPAAGSEASP
jgi:outer membrane protein OmpA-like peptidoglycan-associated protein